MNATATGNAFSLSVMVVLALAIVGLLMWAICSNATVKASGAELGKAMLWTALVAFMMAISGAVLRC